MGRLRPIPQLTEEEYLKALIARKREYEGYDKTDHQEYRKICEQIREKKR